MFTNEITGVKRFAMLHRRSLGSICSAATFYNFLADQFHRFQSSLMTSVETQLAARTRPGGSHVGRQRWNDLLFLHWKVDPQIVQSTLPPGLTADTFDDAAYIGIVPFFMQRVRPRWLPPVPWLSWFMELNVRTYVHDSLGRPGVYFYSLDCNQPVAVWIARKIFRLPYFHARMSSTRANDRVDYSCGRFGAKEESADFSWSPLGVSREAEVGSLEFFLVERYFLFTQGRGGQLFSGQVHHRPYRIRSAAVSRHSVTPAQQAGFELDGPPMSALCATAVDVSIFPLKKCH